MKTRNDGLFQGEKLFTMNGVETDMEMAAMSRYLIYAPLALYIAKERQDLFEADIVPRLPHSPLDDMRFYDYYAEVQ